MVGMTSARRWAAYAFIVSALSAFVVMVGGPQAHAAQCASMTVQYGDVPPDIELAPARVSIDYGGCVSFTNETATTATITVGKSYRVFLGFGETTSGRHEYVGTQTGPQEVSATSGTATASGSITVGPSPTPTPSPTPAQQSSSAGAPPPAPPTSPAPRTTGPQVAPRPKHARRPAVVSRRPLPAASTVVPPTVPTPRVATPGSVPATAVVAGGPIEQPTGRALGLPAALAALAVVGTAAALVRVLLAEPLAAVVDNRRSVGRTA